jgi:seryl-tRNA synthetase
LDHLKLGEKYDLFDFNSATKITGSKFVFLKNQAAILELALVNWTIANVMKRGYTFMTSPDISKTSIIEGCGFSPRDASCISCN